MKTSLRESLLSYVREDKLFGDREIVLEFIKYLEAYCAELNYTEWDVLLNDEHYDVVFELFQNIILKNKPELTL
jgi:hypothetical protein